MFFEGVLLLTDIEYMKMALELAGRGCGSVNPNPMVGAVIVKNGKIIGRGFHERYGEAHAERRALADCADPPEGATLYVTLEPCCHHGKTPPCTDAVIESGIRRVVVGSGDPNPLVAGRGIEILRQNGIEVTEGVLREECDRLNEVFFHFIKTGMPFVVMKYAMTMDGKIATYSGKSKWITGEAARRRVHSDRSRYTGIVVGVGTVLADDPMLDCRLVRGRNPVRIICDTNLRTPLDSNVVRTANSQRTIIAACCADEARILPYRDAGCEILVLPESGGHVDLKALMAALGEMKIDGLLLEGGAALNWSALESGIVNRIQAYIAPKLFGGERAKSPIGGVGVDDPNAAFRLTAPAVTFLDGDLFLESEVIPCSPES